MNAEFQYDVFLSHNQADKPRVRRLAERLHAVNLRVWFDEWGIQPGDLFALRTSDFALPHAMPFRNPTNAGCRFISLRTVTYA